MSVVAHNVPLSRPFDERRVGLDRLGFKVANRDELNRWVTHLDAKGVSHSGILDNGFGLTVVFRDPDNIQLDLFMHPGADELTGVMGVFTEADSADARRLLKG